MPIDNRYYLTIRPKRSMFDFSALLYCLMSAEFVLNIIFYQMWLLINRLGWRDKTSSKPFTCAVFGMYSS